MESVLFICFLAWLEPASLWRKPDLQWHEQTNTKTDRILEDQPDTQLRTSFVDVWHTIGAKIGGGGIYSDFEMLPPPHRFEENIGIKLKGERKPSHDEKPWSAAPPKPLGLPGAGGPTVSPVTETGNLDGFLIPPLPPATFTSRFNMRCWIMQSENSTPSVP